MLRYRWRKIRRRMLLFLAVLLAVFWLLRGKLTPVVLELAQTQVKNTTSDLINDAVAAQIGSGNMEYDRMVYFEKDINGRITALKTNMSEVNRLKTEVLELINRQILALDSTDLGVPIGSMILPELLSGRGPAIPVEVIAIRNSDADFTSRFSEAGINQTLQQLLMEVRVDVTILVLGKTDSFTVTSQVVVAETVIVGDVPTTYLQTGKE